MGASIQLRVKQLVKSRGSFDRDILRDTNKDQYGLFTFVVTGLEDVGSGTQRAKYTVKIALLHLPWTLVWCYQAVKA